MQWVGYSSPAQSAVVQRLAEAAVEKHPDRPSLRVALARAMADAGRLDAARECLKLASAEFPDSDEVVRELATFLSLAGQEGEALLLAESHLNRPWAVSLARRILVRLGRTEEAVRIGAADVNDPDSFALRAAELEDDPEALLGFCDATLERAPGASYALHGRVEALTRLGRHREAVEALALEDLLWREHPPVPAGFPSEDAFLATLVEEIAGNPTLHADPAGHASRRGVRTRVFPLPGDLAAPALLSVIRAEIDRYLERLPDGHPWVAAQPTRARLNPWALIFEGDGRQVRHLHPGSWLTGVYYVCSPAAPPPAGAIRVGGLSTDESHSPGVSLEIAPEPGLLLLFPSYIPHETVPTEAEGRRISIAFDVIAA